MKYIYIITMYMILFVILLTILEFIPKCIINGNYIALIIHILCTIVNIYNFRWHYELIYESRSINNEYFCT